MNIKKKSTPLLFTVSVSMKCALKMYILRAERSRGGEPAGALCNVSISRAYRVFQIGWKFILCKENKNLHRTGTRILFCS